ncbi:MAG TPA: hypothetical protein VFC63_11045 [Blastocatellia bacterium]|nr:hypothetical protein [Blastocatellia bacterium]
MNHFQLGDLVTAKANDVHGIITGSVVTVIPNEGTYSEWLYEVEVPGRRSFYWYESQLDLAVTSEEYH